MNACQSCATILLNPYYCHFCESPAANVAAEVVTDARDRDLGTEANMRALALWYQLGGVLAGLPALAGLLSLWFGESYQPSASRDLGVIKLGLLALAVAQFVIGHYLRQFSEGGRIAAWLGEIAAVVYIAVLIANAGERVTLIVIAFMGLALRIAVFFFLFSRAASRLCTAQYHALVARTPYLKTPSIRQSGFFKAFIIMMMLAFLVPLLA